MPTAVKNLPAEKYIPSLLAYELTSIIKADLLA
ncbi:MAG: hypothetical protein ACI8VT_002670 [Saprospiraceae bacterium]|jgi:hypothetical protein